MGFVGGVEVVQLVVVVGTVWLAAVTVATVQRGRIQATVVGTRNPKFEAADEHGQANKSKRCNMTRSGMKHVVLNGMQRGYADEWSKRCVTDQQKCQFGSTL